MEGDIGERREEETVTKVLMKSVMLYGSENWLPPKEEVKRLVMEENVEDVLEKKHKKMRKYLNLYKNEHC